MTLKKISTLIFAFSLMVVAVANTSYAQVTSTFTVRMEDKMFINTVPLAACNPAGLSAVWTPAGLAAYLAFCKATSLGENPPTPNIVAPLDARIRAGVDLRWQCTAGNPAPFGGFMVRLATAGGTEGPAFLGIKGIVNPIAIRNNINLNGTYGYVSSGFPNPIVEPGFQVHKIRLRSDIWDKISGSITCGTDNRGLPTSRLSYKLLKSAFPSTKLWIRTPMTAPTSVLRLNVAQGTFDNLWALPAIPAP